MSDRQAFDEVCAKFYRTGFSTYEIAQTFRTSQGRVARALKRRGVTMRPKGRVSKYAECARA